MKNIQSAKEFSIQKLSELRKTLATEATNFVIVVGGSIAREEASIESDIDYFFFGEDEPSLKQAQDLLLSKNGEIMNIIGKAPSPNGAFGFDAKETKENLLKNIGGNDDTNQKITRRILFLLEGQWLTAPNTLEKYRREVLNRYISELVESDHLCRFLLNDIIRYYRTICVDFEYKTVEGKKSWGLRNVKLRFSRKLLYFSGVAAVAETMNLDRAEKINKLIYLFNLTPIQRIQSIFGNNFNETLEIYDKFLGKISDGEIRRDLDMVTADRDTLTPNFKELRQLGRDFTIALSQLMTAKYSSKHPIHNAILF